MVIIHYPHFPPLGLTRSGSKGYVGTTLSATWAPLGEAYFVLIVTLLQKHYSTLAIFCKCVTRGFPCIEVCINRNTYPLFQGVLGDGHAL